VPPCNVFAIAGDVAAHPVRVDPAVLLDLIARDSARSYSTVDAVTAIEGIEAEGSID
jgi:hypothetical protein